jgi:hypothetical protein
MIKMKLKQLIYGELEKERNQFIAELGAKGFSHSMIGKMFFNPVTGRHLTRGRVTQIIKEQGNDGS